MPSGKWHPTNDSLTAGTVGIHGVNAAGVQLKNKEARIAPSRQRLAKISMVASTCRTSLAIWIVLTQSSTVSMPRRPMTIFDQTVVSGTILLLSTPSEKHDASARSESNCERGRAPRLKKLGSTAGAIQAPPSSHS